MSGNLTKETCAIQLQPVPVLPKPLRFKGMSAASARPSPCPCPPFLGSFGWLGLTGRQQGTGFTRLLRQFNLLRQRLPKERQLPFSACSKRGLCHHGSEGENKTQRSCQTHRVGPVGGLFRERPVLGHTQRRSQAAQLPEARACFLLDALTFVSDLGFLLFPWSLSILSVFSFPLSSPPLCHTFHFVFKHK